MTMRYPIRYRQKIILITTGGTIGCAVDQNGNLDVSGALAPSLQAEITAHQARYQTEITTIHLKAQLSENLTARSWFKWVAVIQKMLKKQPADAIIISHGSDTFAYSAAAISLLTADIKIPIFFTAALIAPCYKHSDAPRHLKASLNAAASALPRHCYAVFSPDPQQPKPKSTTLAVIYDSCQLQSIGAYRQHFSQVNRQTRGTVLDKAVVFNPKPPLKKTKKALKTMRVGKVQALTVFPNLRWQDAKNFCQNADAILLNLYHSGTACVQGGDFNLLKLLKFCQKKQILVFALPFDNPDLYASNQQLIQHGLLALPMMSLEMALVKLQLLTGKYATKAPHKNHQKIIKAMYTDFCGEITKVKKS